MTTFLTDSLYAGFTGLPGQPLYEATTAVSADVPGKWDVAINGIGFLLDGEPTWHSVPTMRQQQDSREAGELSLNPEALWRRSTSNWDLGAGQVVFDEDLPATNFVAAKYAQRQRFRSSKGVTPWSHGELSLLPDTSLLRTTSGSADVVQVVSTAANVYWGDLNTVYRSDLTTHTAVTGTAATAITSMVSVGSNVLVGYTSNGVYQITAGASTATQWMTSALTPDVVGWAKGRVIMTVGPAVYNLVTPFATPATAPTALWTVADPGFRFVGVAEGTSWIYLGGTSGDKSTIYKTAVKADGTGLDVGSVAGRLPDGETLTSIYGYLGTLVLGTTRGFRLAAANTAGDLTIGSLVDIGHSVNTMLGRGTFVYFGWTNYDSTSTGIGCMDLSRLANPDGLVPAYASDLMVTAQGTVMGLAYLGTIVIGINRVGVYRQHATDLVPSGSLRTGKITFGLTEDKVVLGAQSNFADPGTVGLALSTEGGAFASVGETGTQARGVSHELEITLTRASATTGPTLHSATLHAYPATAGSFLIDVPLIIATRMTLRDDSEATLDLVERVDALLNLYQTKQLVAYQSRYFTFQVTVEAFKDVGENDDNMTATVTLKVYPVGAT